MFFTKYENLCKNSKKTTTGVASELGVAKSTVAYWRANNNVIPKQDVLLKIADYFNVTVDYLLGNEKNSANNGGETLTYKVAAMGGMSGQDTITIEKAKMEKWSELIDATRDLPLEKIDMLIKMAESIK